MLGKHGHDVMHRLAGAGRTRRMGKIPAGLVGEWRYDSSRGPDQDYELTADGYWYIVSPSRQYEISADGSQLDYAPFHFNRTYGFGSTLVGVWREKTTSEEVYFRADGTATYIDAVGQRACLPVKWQTTTGPDHLHWREARSLVGVKGTTFTFYPYEFPDAVFSYKLKGGNKLELTPDHGGRTLTFTRLP
jgi:hypothetical protein